MNIGSAPTGNAIVTPIIDSSYASSLYDYVILNTPLTFTNGATASKSFTVRVFDDAVIENNENIYFGNT